MIKRKASIIPEKVIGIMGSGSSTENSQAAEALGAAFAQKGYIVLTGGGAGIMEAASKGAAEAGGTVLGILPSSGPGDEKYPGYPNQFVTNPIYTGLGDGRNAINVASSDVVVFFPGSAGTLSELGLALKKNKPIVIFNWSTDFLKDLGISGNIKHTTSVEETVQAVMDFISESETT